MSGGVSSDGARRVLAVVTGYQGFIAALRARKVEMGMSDKDLEYVGGLASGHVSQVLTRGAPKALGPLSFGRVLRGLGLELHVVENTELTAAARAQYNKRDESQVRVRAIAIKPKPTWLLNRRKARELRHRQLQMFTPQERSRIARKAARNRWKRWRREKAERR